MVQWETLDDFGQFLRAAINEAEIWKRFKKDQSIVRADVRYAALYFLVSCCDEFSPQRPWL
jgi:hypothetical protein